MKIFLLEDDYSLNEAIKEILEIEKHVVYNFYDGEVAFDNIVNNNYDLYILDINVPNISGLDVLEKIKSISLNSNVIIISANVNIGLIKEAYILGCDDYLKKPFDLEELVLKIKRYGRNPNNINLTPNISFSILEKELYLNTEKIELTKNERNLLYLLIKNMGNTISYSQIEDFVYDGKSKSSDAIRSLIKRLRKKLTEDLILNSLDEGYYIKNNK
jgi:DNA-binding response OmpR family regulator